MEASASNRWAQKLTNASLPSTDILSVGRISIDLRRTINSNCHVTVYDIVIISDAAANIQAFVRASNLAKKAEATEIKENVFVADEEKALYDVYKSTNSAVASLVDGEDYVGAIDALKELAKPIDAFFDAVMVMDKDEAVKNNRLALLHALDALVNKVADFSKIVL